MDRRIRKTKKRIWQAFETLSGKKAVTEITVAGLCELADINRSTFYQYYADIYALFEEIEQEYIQRVEFMIEKLRHTENSQEVVEEILEFLSLHRTAILYFLKNRQYTHFFELCQTLLENFFRDKIRQNYYVPCNFPKERLDFAVGFLSVGCYQIYLDWLERKINYTVQELSFYISDLSDTYFRAHFQEKNQRSGCYHKEDRT